MARVELTDIAGIGPAAAAELRRAGIADAESLTQAPASALEAVRGFGPARSAAVQSAARALLASRRPPKAATTKSEQKDKKDRKDKRKKRDKKRDKKKRDKGKKRGEKGGKDEKRKKRKKRDKGSGKKDKKGKKGKKRKKGKK